MKIKAVSSQASVLTCIPGFCYVYSHNNRADVSLENNFSESLLSAISGFANTVHSMVTTAACSFLILSLLFFTETTMAIEEPKYTLIEKAGKYELRAYSPKILAETFVSGSADSASRAGFKLIADYIFGNNTSPAGGNEKISMTAPVTMEPRSEKISMTAPVTMEQTDGQWRVHFVMPSGYTLETLPKPNNPAVRLTEVPETNYAVISFSGFTGENKVAKKTADLMAWLDSKGITPAGAPELARYNPPWTLPFLRRNEIMVEY